MRKFSVLLLFGFIGFAFAQWPVTRGQSDWHSGAGLIDTVDSWGFRYFSGGGINDATAPLMLLADPASYIYTAWIQHTIDNSAEIGTFNWCVRPALIDGDEIPDIVANLNDAGDAGTAYIVWYEGPPTGWAYTRHTIHTYSTTDLVGGAYPADIDNDGDIDVVAGTNTGLYWFENNGSGGGWAQHTIYPTVYDVYRAWYYDVGDADGDGWLDVMVTEVEEDGVLFIDYYTYCTIYWNNGAAPDYFDWSGPAPGGNTLVSSWGANEGQFWRAVFFDPDPADGFLDVAYERVAYDAFGDWDEDSLIVKVQNPARTFTAVFHNRIDCAPDFLGNPTGGHDGLWNNDFDGDSEEDLVVAAYRPANGFFYIVESDPGDIFTYHEIIIDPNASYMDGAIMFDMDNDGMQDVVGDFDSIAYFRRTGPGYTDFTLFEIDDLTGWSHWVYPYNLDRGECSGDADIDAIVTHDDAVLIFENQMFSFETAGSLYSAILAIPLPNDTCVRCSIYWEGCQIPEYGMNISGRFGSSLADCQAAIWSAPAPDPFHVAPHGWLVGSIHTPIDTVWVQYWIDMSRVGAAIDLSPLVDSVWVSIIQIPCDCEEIEAEWICPVPCSSYVTCIDQVMQIILWTDSTTIDLDRIYFTVNDGVTPPYTVAGSSPNVSSMCLDPPDCDSVFVEIFGYIWSDGATVTISVDSGYTTDGCFTVFHP